MAELRTIIASFELPDTIHRVGKRAQSTDAYEIDLDVGILVGVYDRRGQSIATFLLLDATEITRTIPTEP